MNIARGVSILFLALCCPTLPAKAQFTAPSPFSVNASLFPPTVLTAQTRPLSSPVIPFRFSEAPLRSLGVPVRSIQRPTLPAKTTVSVSGNDRLLNGILELLKDAVITDVDAKISLEKTEVEAGRVRLTGLLIENFRIGLHLNARGTKKLAELLAARNAQNGKPTAQARPSEFSQILEILKLGIFNRLDINLKLKSLRVRELSVDADQLRVAGLLVTASAKSDSFPWSSAVSSSTLRNLMEVLRRASLSRVDASAGLDELNAQRLHLLLSGTALEGLSVGLSLRREDA